MSDLDPPAVLCRQAEAYDKAAEQVLDAGLDDRLTTGEGLSLKQVRAGLWVTCPCVLLPRASPRVHAWLHARFSCRGPTGRWSAGGVRVRVLALLRLAQPRLRP